MQIALLPAALVARPTPSGDNPLHAVVEPAFSMPFSAYQALLASTAFFWQIVAK
jgi:hypothetical protein